MAETSVVRTDAGRVVDANVLAVLSPILDAIPFYVLIVDAQHNILAANKAVAHALGKPPAELLGCYCPKVIHGLDGPFAGCPLEDSRHVGGGPVEKEYYDETKDLWVESVVYPAGTTVEGRPVYLHFVRDISARKRAEAALEESRNLLNAVIEGTTDMVFVKDRQGRHLLVNEACTRFLGRPAGDILGKDAAELLPPEQARKLSELDRMVMEGGQPVVLDEEIGPPGMCRAFLTVKAPYRDSAGEVAGLVGIARDITDRKRAEEADQFLSRASKELAGSLDYRATLTKLAELAVDRLCDWCVVELLEGGAVQRVACAHRDTTKSDLVAELLRRPPSELEHEHPLLRVVRTGRAVVGGYSDAEQAPGPKDSDYRRILRELGIGAYMAVPLSARATTIGVLGLVRADPLRHYDTADLALAEELARRAAMAIDNARLYEAAKQARQAREQLLAVVSHDLRSPLGAIALNAELIAQLAAGGDAAGATSKARQIQRQTKLMVRLIRDLLDAAAIEAGHIPVERQRRAIEPILEQAIELMMPMVRERSLRLERKISAELPEVECDGERILQVLSNLIDNAIKYTPQHGCITIIGEREDNGVRIAVADTGMGIAEKAAPHLFDRYWQADRSRRAGAGLGLFIVKGIVEAHHGRVWFESEPGQGSTFFFTLPVSPQDEAS